MKSMKLSKRTRLVALVALAPFAAACGEGGGPQPATVVQQQATEAALKVLGQVGQSKDPWAVVGQLYSSTMLLMLAQSTGGPQGLPGTQFQRATSAGEDCVTESGTTVTFNCPNVKGVVIRRGEYGGANFDLKMYGLMGVQEMHFWGDVYASATDVSGSLGFDLITNEGGASITVSFDVTRGGECPSGWLELTGTGTSGRAPPYRAIRVDIANCSYTVTYL